MILDSLELVDADLIFFDGLASTSTFVRTQVGPHAQHGGLAWFVMMAAPSWPVICRPPSIAASLLQNQGKIFVGEGDSARERPIELWVSPETRDYTDLIVAKDPLIRIINYGRHCHGLEPGDVS